MYVCVHKKGASEFHRSHISWGCAPRHLIQSILRAPCTYPGPLQSSWWPWIHRCMKIALAFYYWSSHGCRLHKQHNYVHSWMHDSLHMKIALARPFLAVNKKRCDTFPTACAFYRPRKSHFSALFR